MSGWKKFNFEMPFAYQSLHLSMMHKTRRWIWRKSGSAMTSRRSITCCWCNAFATKRTKNVIPSNANDAYAFTLDHTSERKVNCIGFLYWDFRSILHNPASRTGTVRIYQRHQVIKNWTIFHGGIFYTVLSAALFSRDLANVYFFVRGWWHDWCNHNFLKDFQHPWTMA